MNRTKIEWCDYTINPVKGLCPMACSYCYARKMYKRFRWNPEIRYDDSVWDGIWALRKPSRIFVGSTIELFGDWVKEDWLDIIIGHAELLFPQNTFIFLTKQPQNLIKWSPFPENCWVGVSTPNASDAIRANKFMSDVKASVKFLSIEPMFDWNLFPDTLRGILYGYQWVILGSQTQPVKHPRTEWVTEIIEAADKAKIPVFIKEPLASHIGIQRQEYPK